jgi:hypothetical protein
MESTNAHLTADGFFLARDALAIGHDRRSIAAAVRRGDWHRVRHGAYTTTEHWQQLDARSRRLLVAKAAYRTADTEVAMSHTTALDAFEVPYWDLPDLTHLTRFDERAGRRGAGVVQHHGALTADDLTRLDDRWFTSGTRTALDCIALTDVERGLVVTSGLLHARRTTSELLAQHAERLIRTPHSRSRHIVLRLADPRLTTVAEARAFFLFWDQGIPLPIPQYPVYDRNGRLIAYLDFAWPDLGVFAEFDGKIKYTTLLRPDETAADVLLREKRREALVCGLTQMRAIRLDWSDLSDPARTAARVNATLAGRPWAA